MLNLLTYSQLSSWQNKYTQIYPIKIADQQYVIRPLSIQPIEWKNPFNETVWQYYEFEGIDEVVQDCILWPENADLDSRAGTVSAIFSVLYQVSNFQSRQEWESVISTATNLSNTRQEALKGIIIAAMPSYTPDALNEKNLFELIYLAAMGSNILKMRGVQIDLMALVKEPKTNKSQGFIDFEQDNKKINQAIYGAAVPDMNQGLGP
jgi:hypothetical protein